MSTRAPESGTVSPLLLAEGARRVQLNLRQSLLVDVTRAWPVLNFSDLGSTWPAWLQLMSSLLTRYHADSATAASLYYRAARQAATGDPGAPETVLLASPPTPEWMRKALGYAAPGQYDRQVRAKVLPEAAARSALVKTLGTSSRIALDGGRTTIADTTDADQAAFGFARITDGDPCPFCALIASRGAVYKTAEAAGEARQWHNDCGCTVAPSFSETFEISGAAARAQDIYYGGIDQLPNRERMTAFRQAWLAR